MHWTHRIGEENIKSKQSPSLAAFKNWVVMQPTYRVSGDLQQIRGNEMGSIRSWFKRLLSYDHRQGERLEAPLLVAYYWDGSVPTAHKLRDISATGFYLFTTERWRPGTIVTMTLQRSDTIALNPSDEHYISVHAKVVRLGEDGVGLVFVPVESKRSDSTQTSKSKVADKKALRKFLDHLKLDEGCIAITLDRRAEKEMLFGHGARLRISGEDVVNRLKDESGQSLVIAALAMTCLLGFVALAADVGTMFRERRLVQTAADSAAVAGASELNFGDATAAAQAAAAQNGFTNGANGATVLVHPPPTSGPHQFPGYVEVIVSQSQPTFFMQLFGRSAMTVSGRAVATNLGKNQGCVYTLGTTGTDIAWHGSGTTNISTCSILDNSSDPRALTFNGSGSLTAQSIGIAGGFRKTGSGTLTPNPPTVGIVPVSDPLAFLTPPANPGSCQGTPAHPYTPPGSSLTPGCYGGLTISGSGTVTLAAGLYYIDGPFKITGSGTVSGTNVTIYLTNNNGASFTTSGSGTLSLSAPTSGSYNGILFYQNPNNTGDMSINGSGTLNLQGIIYAPGSNLTMNGSGSSQFYTALVTNSLTFNGSGSWQDYAIKNAGSLLTAVKLVE